MNNYSVGRVRNSTISEVYQTIHITPIIINKILFDNKFKLKFMNLTFKTDFSCSKEIKWKNTNNFIFDF